MNPLQQAYGFRGKTVSEHSQASTRVLHGISVGELISLRKSTSNTFVDSANTKNLHGNKLKVENQNSPEHLHRLHYMKGPEKLSE